MSNPDIPMEVLDHIVNLLHNEMDALKSCCLASKSWIPRTRKHLFAEVKFRDTEGMNAWRSTFLDPSTSPARYTKSLIIQDIEDVTARDAEEGGYIPTFSRVKHFEVNINSPRIFLVPFHGFSPAITSLHIKSLSFPCSHIFNLICSFPLLEDLSLASSGQTPGIDSDEQPASRPSSSPAFTGSLKLSFGEGISLVASRLLSLPGGLHFCRFKIILRCEEDVLPAGALIEGCSSTLESLEIDSWVFHRSPDSINLSKATMLRNVAFAFTYDFNPRLITMALQTIAQDHQNFQQVSISSPIFFDTLVNLRPDPAVARSMIGEPAFLGWLELDRLLARFHESHLIRPKVLLWKGRQWRGGCMEYLLPEVVARGIVDSEDVAL